MHVGTDSDCTEVLLDGIRRHAAFDALESRPSSKRELAEAIGVSGATAHRILTSFREAGLVERTDEGHVVTALGREVAGAADAYRAHVEAALGLEALLTAIDPRDVGLDVTAFVDATITVAEPGNPYRPLNRFATLLEETTSLRGFDTTSVSPTYVEDVHAMILDGMDVTVVYDHAVVDQLTTEYTELAGDAFDHDNLDLSVHDDVPFGLALFDDRVGVGGYDENTGLLSVFVDTDDPAALEWGERLFESFRDEATPV